MDKTELTPIDRTFLLEYARFRMLVETDVMGVEEPGIEFWLLGLLHLVSITSYRLDIFSTPNATWQDKLQVRSRIRQELAARRHERVVPRLLFAQRSPVRQTEGTAGYRHSSTVQGLLQAALGRPRRRLPPPS